MAGKSAVRAAIVVAFCFAGFTRPCVGHGSLSVDSTEIARRVPTPNGSRAVWSATGLYSYARFSSGRPSWRSEALLIRRRVPRRSTVDVEAGLITRHGEHDPYAAVDMYRTFGSRSYGNLRLSAAPGAAVTARTDLYTEFFHSPGLGWEFSVGYRRADYALSGANTWMVGAAKYVGNWYVRIRPSATQVAGTFGYALMGTIRRYFGRPDEHIGLMVARGREIVAFPGDAGIQARNSLSGSLSYQRDLGRSTGVRLGVEAVRDGDLSRWGFTTGVLWRW